MSREGNERGDGSEWTRRNPPLKILNKYTCLPGRNPSLEEDSRVKKLMLKHGVDKVSWW
jgi:hypothetical protein